MVLQSSGKSDQVEPRLANFAAMKARWTIGMQSIVKDELRRYATDKRDKRDDLETNTKLFEIFVELVASDLTFYHSGEKGLVVESNLRLIRLLKSEGLVDALKFTDPFGALEKFKENPNAEISRIHTAEAVFKDLNSYQSFCDWFVKSVELAKPADVPE
jgi:hypothetical protein